jgi:hypothetical protein
MLGQGVGVRFYKKARSKTHATCESMLKSMRNVRKRATFFNFLLVFSVFFDFFIFFEGVHADLIARVEGSFSGFGGGQSGYVFGPRSFGCPFGCAQG